MIIHGLLQAHAACGIFVFQDLLRENELTGYNLCNIEKMNMQHTDIAKGWILTV